MNQPESVRKRKEIPIEERREIGSFFLLSSKVCVVAVREFIKRRTAKIPRMGIGTKVEGLIFGSLVIEIVS